MEHEEAVRRYLEAAQSAVGENPQLSGIPARNVEKVAVIGGGTMGAGIAAAFLTAGFDVTLVERDGDALEKGCVNVEKIFASQVKKRRINDSERDAILARLSSTTDYADLSEVDLAVEAVFEDLNVKRQVFGGLDKVLKQGAILATNTSYLDVNQIAHFTNRPEDVVGLHFFSPAHIMKLLEIVKADKTAPEVIATGFDLAKKLRKVGVQSGVCDGFIGNRILKVYRQQAERLLIEGASPADVDASMRAFGMPMGPFEAQDLGGLDIAAFQRKAAQDRGEIVFAPVANRLCEMQRYGQKTQGGWYDYVAGDRTPHLSAVVNVIITEERATLGMKVFPHDEASIQKRILLPMIDEAAKIVEEGIAQRPLDVDMVEIFGYGFPRARGGLMYYADSLGIASVVAELEKMVTLDGAPYQPCDLLKRLAKEGQSLASLNEGI